MIEDPRALSLRAMRLFASPRPSAPRYVQPRLGVERVVRSTARTRWQRYPHATVSFQQLPAIPLDSPMTLVMFALARSRSVETLRRRRKRGQSEVEVHRRSVVAGEASIDGAMGGFAWRQMQSNQTNNMRVVVARQRPMSRWTFCRRVEAEGKVIA